MLPGDACLPEVGESLGGGEVVIDGGAVFLLTDFQGDGGLRGGEIQLVLLAEPHGLALPHEAANDGLTGAVVDVGDDGGLHVLKGQGVVLLLVQIDFEPCGVVGALDGLLCIADDDAGAVVLDGGVGGLLALYFVHCCCGFNCCL